MSLARNIEGIKVESKQSKPKSVVENQEKPESLNSRNENLNEEEDPDDPCLKKNRDREGNENNNEKYVHRSVGEDPRFQQQNKTLRCYVSYIDFFRCENILGEGHEACEWFKKSYNTFCPLRWIERFDEAREEGRFPLHRKDQGKFPGNKYG